MIKVVVLIILSLSRSRFVLTMVPLKAVLAHASTSWDGAGPVEPLDITVWEKVPVGGRLASGSMGPAVSPERGLDPFEEPVGDPFVGPDEGPVEGPARPAAEL